MSRNAPRNPPLWMHQGTMIPWSKSYNYQNSMKLVGLEGLEPSTKGFTIPRAPTFYFRKIKNPKGFSFCPSDCRPKPSLCRTRLREIPNGLRVSRRRGKISGNRTPNHHRTAASGGKSDIYRARIIASLSGMLTALRPAVAPSPWKAGAGRTTEPHHTVHQLGNRCIQRLHGLG